MKNFLYLSAIIIFCSCNSEKKDSNKTVISTPAGLEGLPKDTTTITAPQNPNKTLIFNPKHGQAGHTCALAEGAPLNQNAAAQPQQNINSTQPAAVSIPAPVTNTNGKKLNPKHGEPGHRCDIAVGALLDSKPVQAAQASVSQPVVTQTANTKVAKGINPPHGQPNHRCDIAVGAPLSSKPVQAAAVNPAPNTTITPAAVKTSETQTGAKLNPKHGDPGHRCDIAVGAPLT
ncbi:hypothetical protein [Pedobacter sp. Leaf250]|uniref:hypothetical protein n=1 Tax=Pedobacter sp. Leaf250 TaxID=2876559 RepID=UPI001E2FC31D|nr:hypothetical protein [Pedobacter sp. Leaf250]